MDQVRKRKAAELAALKLGLNDARLEEHVGKSCSLIWIKIAVSGRSFCYYSCSIILDNSATVGSLPFGVNLLTITGIPCDSCLVSSSSETPVI
jgi:hypothetical protein